ncbi:MAG: YwiC-like family protein [Anaerolineales bacterium]|jgi:hypothetical protein
MGFRQYLRRHIAIPSEHGSWVFLLSPLLIGIFAGESWSIATIFLSIAAISGFLIRQPISIAVKVKSDRRSKRDMPAARFWMFVYGLIGIMMVLGLLILDYGFILILVIPAVPVFIWHLMLISKRAERRQIGVEIVASGVLALCAPAAYWIGVGEPVFMGWVLWVLTWFQSAASIVYAYLRLNQRVLKKLPNLGERWEMAKRSLQYTTFNLISVLFLSTVDILPTYIYLPYALQWLETLWGGLVKPAVGTKPTIIGLRQLIISSLFTIVFITTWYI